MKRDRETLEPIEPEQLAAVDGGGVGDVVKKGGKFLGKKAGPIGLAWAAYDGVSAGVDSYKKGSSWGKIAKDAALGALW